MEGFDEFVIVVNVFNIVQLLKYKMAWVIKYIYGCERACKARKIDVIIGDTAHPELDGLWHCVTTDLASPNRDWRHDRVKLQQAIEAQLA